MGSYSPDQTAPPQTAGEAVTSSLRYVLTHGERITTASGKTWLEALAFQTGMCEPRRRIFTHSVRGLDLVAAISRFVWMMRGDESASAIAYYVPRAGAYAPDGLALPGSNYGHRLRRSLPGVDQVQGVVNRLRAQPESRQAGTVIWNPMDAVREPIDVPCAVGTLYHLRSAGLCAMTMMRSNKPLTLMPFNFFEFSLLGEVIAAELGAPLGPYRHWVGAMQLPGPEIARAEEFLQGARCDVEMAIMPSDPAPLAQINVLARLEERLRAAHDGKELQELLAEAVDVLHPYWIAFARVLSLRWYMLRERLAEAVGEIEKLPDYFAEPISTMKSLQTNPGHMSPIAGRG